MCFPLQFLKLIHTIAAVTLIIFGSISYKDYHYLMTSNAVYITFIMIGVFAVFISIIGILGSKRQDRCLIGAFNCFLLILTLILLLITLILIFTGINDKNTLGLSPQNQIVKCKTASKNTITLHNIALAAEQDFCSQNCICYIQNASAWTSGSLNNFTYTPYPQIPHNIYQFQQCKDFNFQYETDQVNYLASLEERFDCAGWCYNSPIFLFTNVNRGQPIQNCFVTYASKIGQRYLNFGYLALALTFLLVTEVTMSCCYQFHPDRDPKKQRLYKVIRYYED